MRRANGDASRLGAGLGLGLLATALLAGRLAEGDLIGDPVIYAAVAKSMLVRGEWATQYLAGQPFFDKP
ncbi:MAG: dolichol-phosphate mannosyltransferase, partial [Deltaproteobacteria bacterium]